ncbi:MAG: septum formation initiator family protein [Candidatus Nomurabacteria bacterium]|nr:MAG: septum formation initiator family protein [Candidatus Nomurabacteria bacterium]
MPRKSKKRQTQQNPLAKTRFVLALALLVLAVISTSIVKELIRRHDVHSELSGLSEEIAALESRNTELGSLLTYLQSSTYHEQEARLKLGLQGQGERVLIVPGSEKTLPDNVNVENAKGTDPQKVQGNPNKWWKWLFLAKD